MPIVHDPKTGQFVATSATGEGSSERAKKRETEKAHNKSTAATLTSYKTQRRKSKSERELFG